MLGFGRSSGRPSVRLCNLGDCRTDNTLAQALVHQLIDPSIEDPEHIDLSIQAAALMVVDSLWVTGVESGLRNVVPRSDEVLAVLW